MGIPTTVARDAIPPPLVAEVVLTVEITTTTEGCLLRLVVERKNFWGSNARLASRQDAVLQRWADPSVRRRLLDMIDDEDIDRPGWSQLRRR